MLNIDLQKYALEGHPNAKSPMENDTNLNVAKSDNGFMTLYIIVHVTHIIWWVRVVSYMGKFLSFVFGTKPHPYTQ